MANNMHRHFMFVALFLLSSAAALPVPPSYAWGPDVSDYEGAVDWTAVKTAGASFAFTKATEGTTFTCETFATNWEGMRHVGIGLRRVTL